MKEEYIRKWRETGETAYRIIAQIMDQPEGKRKNSLRRLVCDTWKPERRPIYLEALERLIEDK